VNGPNGAAFNDKGHLLVAAYSKFVEFSAPGVACATYGKLVDEATETILFDKLGNLYTTTATGGSDKLNQYSASNYSFIQTIALPSGSGQLTGLVFDDQDRLFVVSQTGAKIICLQADSTFTTFTYSHTIPSQNTSYIEGIQIDINGNLVAAGGNLTIYDCDSGAKLNSFDAPNNHFPVPVMVGDQGSIYVADFENGNGTVSADLFKFSPDGSSYVTANDPGLFGPFGIAIPRVHKTALWLDKYYISEATGGTVNFTLDATIDKKFRKYIILGSLSGSVPGTKLPGGLVKIPINWDVFTDKVFELTVLGSPLFPNFLGKLDMNGQSWAQVSIPAFPGSAGITMYFAYCLGSPWEFVSNPVELVIVP